MPFPTSSLLGTPYQTYTMILSGKITDLCLLRVNMKLYISIGPSNLLALNLIAEFIRQCLCPSWDSQLIRVHRTKLSNP